MAPDSFFIRFSHTRSPAQRYGNLDQQETPQEETGKLFLKSRRCSRQVLLHLTRCSTKGNPTLARPSASRDRHDKVLGVSSNNILGETLHTVTVAVLVWRRFMGLYLVHWPGASVSPAPVPHTGTVEENKEFSPQTFLPDRHHKQIGPSPSSSLSSDAIPTLVLGQTCCRCCRCRVQAGWVHTASCLYLPQT